MLICVFPGSAYWSQSLLGNVAWVLAIGAGGDWSLCNIPGRMVFLQLLNLELSCNWQVPGLNIYPSLQGLFHKVSLMWVSGICGRLRACHYSVNGMVLRISC